MQIETIAKSIILSAFLLLIGCLVYLINNNRLTLKSGFTWLVSYLSLSIIAIGFSLPVTILLVYSIALFGYMAFKVMEVKV